MSSVRFSIDASISHHVLRTRTVLQVCLPDIPLICRSMWAWAWTEPAAMTVAICWRRPAWPCSFRGVATTAWTVRLLPKPLSANS